MSCHQWLQLRTNLLNPIKAPVHTTYYWFFWSQCSPQSCWKTSILTHTHTHTHTHTPGANNNNFTYNNYHNYNNTYHTTYNNYHNYNNSYHTSPVHTSNSTHPPRPPLPLTPSVRGESTSGDSRPPLEERRVIRESSRSEPVITELLHHHQENICQSLDTYTHRRTHSSIVFLLC